MKYCCEDCNTKIYVPRYFYFSSTSITILKWFILRTLPTNICYRSLLLNGVRNVCPCPCYYKKIKDNKIKYLNTCRHLHSFNNIDWYCYVLLHNIYIRNQTYNCINVSRLTRVKVMRSNSRDTKLGRHNTYWCYVMTSFLQQTLLTRVEYHIWNLVINYMLNCTLSQFYYNSLINAAGYFDIYLGLLNNIK